MSFQKKCLLKNLNTSNYAYNKHFNNYLYFNLEENLYWFASMERTGGPWDYKQVHSDSGHVLSLCVSSIDKDSQHILDPTDKEKTRCAYGDDPKDQNEIKRGIMYARMLGYIQAG